MTNKTFKPGDEIWLHQEPVRVLSVTPPEAHATHPYTVLLLNGDIQMQAAAKDLFLERKETVHERSERQNKEAGDRVREDILDGWISTDGSSMVSFDKGHADPGELNLLLTTYEWGDAREEVSLKTDDVLSLYEWLGERLNSLSPIQSITVSEKKPYKKTSKE